MKKRVLIVEDEEPLRKVYLRRLMRKGYRVDGVSTAEAGLRALENHDFNVALVDFRMPGMNGLDFIKAAKESRPILEVIMITAFGSIETAVKAMKLGAYDYLTKPCQLPELEILVAKACEKNAIQRQNILLKEALRAKDAYDDIIYRSSKMKQLMEDLKKVARTDSSVIIEGESGTGKELKANAIHKLSPRKNGAFIVVNCANLSETLLENELFGHEKGAYTGASHEKRGLVELADEGTLFIDEIGELHSQGQAKLLRILERKTFRRVGGNDELRADIRVIAASNRNLSEEVSKKRFRQDLFFRLNVVYFNLPPLRERREDIPLLIDYFVEKKNRHLKENRKMSPEALTLCIDYEWPGNIRELANIIERAIILSSGEYIEPRDLPFWKPDKGGMYLLTIKEMEKDHIEKALKVANGNKTQAAKILGISVRNLYRKLEE
ncbi:MAG: sigma-54-dependent Fis family transcriptional regulator [Deltaproteobacteria bacterium]|nr:sigma-54-dependent Fis family transcriptional regulator [Deltaproteobacteria bacterium]